MVQLVFNMSDRVAEDSLKDSFSIRKFVGLTMDSPSPKVTTILRFRHILEEHGLTEKSLSFKKEVKIRKIWKLAEQKIKHGLARPKARNSRKILERAYEYEKLAGVLKKSRDLEYGSSCELPHQYPC